MTADLKTQLEELRSRTDLKPDEKKRAMRRLRKQIRKTSGQSGEASVKHRQKPQTEDGEEKPRGKRRDEDPVKRFKRQDGLSPRDLLVEIKSVLVKETGLPLHEKPREDGSGFVIETWPEEKPLQGEMIQALKTKFLGRWEHEPIWCAVLIEGPKVILVFGPVENPLKHRK